MENDPSKWISVKLITSFVSWGSQFSGFNLKKNFSWLFKLNKLIILSLGLTTYLEDAQKRKEQEQANYVQKIVRWFLQLW